MTVNPEHVVALQSLTRGRGHSVLRCHHVQKDFSITSEELARVWKRADETNPTGDDIIVRLTMDGS